MQRTFAMNGMFSASTWRALVLAIAAVSVFALAAVPARAQKAKTIAWEDLAPEYKPLKDPLAKLPVDVRYSIQTIAWVRGLDEKQRKLPSNASLLKDAAQQEADLRKKNIDVDRLIIAYAKQQLELLRRESTVVPALNGKRIRMAGYLLPLSFSGKGETEFLLVPEVGSCIHVPPPPPNQIVYVKLANAFTPKDMFTPVWITGKLATKASRRTLSLADGSAPVPVGYHLAGQKIEPYKQ